MQQEVQKSIVGLKESRCRLALLVEWGIGPLVLYWYIFLVLSSYMYVLFVADLVWEEDVIRAHSCGKTLSQKIAPAAPVESACGLFRLSNV